MAGSIVYISGNIVYMSGSMSGSIVYMSVIYPIPHRAPQPYMAGLYYPKRLKVKS